MSHHPASTVDMCHQHILSIFSLAGSLCSWTGSVSRPTSDWFSIHLSFTAVHHWMKHHIYTVASSVTPRRTPFARRHFSFCQKTMFLHSGEAINPDNSDVCSGNLEGWGDLYDLQPESTLPPYSFHSLSIFPPYTLSLSFHLELPCGQIVVLEPLSQQEGRVGWSGGDYDSHRMRGEKTRKVAGNKVALIRTCQQQSAHKAVWESNLVSAVSLSDISAISCHRSVCEPGALSDFLKSN